MGRPHHTQGPTRGPGRRPGAQPGPGDPFAGTVGAGRSGARRTGNGSSPRPNDLLGGLQGHHPHRRRPVPSLHRLSTTGRASPLRLQACADLRAPVDGAGTAARRLWRCLRTPGGTATAPLGAAMRRLPRRPSPAHPPSPSGSLRLGHPGEPRAPVPSADPRQGGAATGLERPRCCKATSAGKSLQEAFDRWRTMADSWLKRPPPCLELAVCPSAATLRARRRSPGDAPPITFDGDADLIAEDAWGLRGWVSGKGRTFPVGRASCRGYPVALRPAASDGVWGVWFMTHPIAEVDLRSPEPLVRRRLFPAPMCKPCPRTPETFSPVFGTGGD